MLPVGVVIPTLNSMTYLQRHLASVAAWASLIPEIIVVDSQSTDGTPEFIREHLKHPNVQIFSRPKGLYQAWNFGVGQVRSRYAYISTIGDTMMADGLAHLTSVAESLQSDVVISPPSFIDAAGCAMPDFRWPIHQIIKNCEINRPQLLSRTHLILSALTNGLSSYLGSSASNLYRTEVLQQRPFPWTFGHVGDTAWGIAHCADLNVAVTPTVCSTFLFHSKDSEPVYAELMPKFRQLVRETKAGLLANRTLRRSQDVILACELWEQMGLEYYYQDQINEARRLYQRPYRFNFEAWIARLRRNRQRRRSTAFRERLANIRPENRKFFNNPG